MDDSTLRALIPKEAFDLCREFESLRLHAYICPAGKVTIGYGHTGPDVRMGDSITAERAEELLADDLLEAMQSVVRLLPDILEQKSGRVAAVVDFTFNLGAGNLEHSTLRQRILDGDWEDVPFQLRRWVKARDPKTGKLVTLRGLVRRRDAEAALV